MSLKRRTYGGEDDESSPLFVFDDPSAEDGPGSLSSVGDSVGVPEVLPAPSPFGASGDELSNWRAILSYVGTNYHGFAAQDGLATVAGELTSVLSRVYQSPIVLTCSGRTDAGVHAVTQVVTFRAPVPQRRSSILRSVNQLLSSSIRVRTIEQCSSTFDARHDAKYRGYVYRLASEELPSALTVGRAWAPPGPLDVGTMRNGAYALIGEHDFVAWCKSSRGAERPTRRHVYDVSFRPSEMGLDIAIWANSFCQQMVRSIVGSLVEVGRGRRSGSYLRDLIVSQDRRAIGLIAPPEGLYLYEVGFRDFDGSSVRRWESNGFDPLRGGMGLWTFPV